MSISVTQLAARISGDHSGARLLILSVSLALPLMISLRRHSGPVHLCFSAPACSRSVCAFTGAEILSHLYTGIAV